MLDIIVIGAGTSGLSAACFLAKAGHKVRVLERRSEVGIEGGSIAFRPGAARTLEHFGLADEIAEAADEAPANAVFDVYNLEPILRLPAVGHEYTILRADLVRMMFAAARKAGADVIFNTSVASVSDQVGQRPYVTLTDGRRLEADLIVAANGVRSTLRAQVLGDLVNSNLEPQISECCVYQWRTPLARLQESEKGRVLLKQEICSYLGHGGFFFTYLSPKSGHFIGILVCPDDQYQPGVLYEEGVDFSPLIDRFSDFSPSLLLALELGEDRQRWRITEIPDLPRWSSREGRIVLLGDCATGMHPNAGQGCSTGIETAGALATVLSSRFVSSASQVPEMIRTWEAARNPRVEDIKAFSKFNTQSFGSYIPPALRSKINRTMPRVDRDERIPRWLSPSHFDWLCTHDAVAHAEQIIQQGGVQLKPTDAKL